MNVKKIIYYLSFLIWSILTGCVLYRYYVHVGYWKNPLLLSLLFYIVIIFINKGFNKLIGFMTLIYISFFIWFMWDMFRMLTDWNTEFY